LTVDNPVVQCILETSANLMDQFMTIETIENEDNSEFLDDLLALYSLTLSSVPEFFTGDSLLQDPFTTFHILPFVAWLATYDGPEWTSDGVLRVVFHLLRSFNRVCIPDSRRLLPFVTNLPDRLDFRELVLSALPAIPKALRVFSHDLHRSVAGELLSFIRDHLDIALFVLTPQVFEQLLVAVVSSVELCDGSRCDFTENPHVYCSDAIFCWGGSPRRFALAIAFSLCRKGLTLDVTHFLRGCPRTEGFIRLLAELFTASRLGEEAEAVQSLLELMHTCDEPKDGPAFYAREYLIGESVPFLPRHMLETLHHDISNFFHDDTDQIAICLGIRRFRRLAEHGVFFDDDMLASITQYSPISESDDDALAGLKATLEANPARMAELAPEIAPWMYNELNRFNGDPRSAAVCDFLDVMYREQCLPIGQLIEHWADYVSRLQAPAEFVSMCVQLAKDGIPGMLGVVPAALEGLSAVATSTCHDFLREDLLGIVLHAISRFYGELDQWEGTEATVEFMWQFFVEIGIYFEDMRDYYLIMCIIATFADLGKFDEERLEFATRTALDHLRAMDPADEPRKALGVLQVLDASFRLEYDFGDELEMVIEKLSILSESGGICEPETKIQFGLFGHRLWEATGRSQEVMQLVQRIFESPMEHKNPRFTECESEYFVWQPILITQLAQMKGRFISEGD
jgi:hypothetical protein